MPNLRDVRRKYQENQAQKQSVTPFRYAYLGDGRGYSGSNMFAPGESASNLLWARETLGSDRFFPILNRNAVVPQFDLPIVIGYKQDEPRSEQILGVHVGGLGTISPSAVPLLGPHHHQHEYGGGDEVFSDGLLLKPGLVTPTNPASMRLSVLPFVYFWDTWQRYVGGTTDDLTPFIPPSNRFVYVTIALDPVTGNLVYRNGNIISFVPPPYGSFTFDFDNVAAPSGNELPLAYILLENGLSVIDWASFKNSIGDARLHVGAPMLNVNSRLRQLEGYTGNDPNLATTGAAADTVADNFHRIQDLSDVSLTGLSNGKALVYQQATNQWVPGSVSGGTGHTIEDEGIPLTARTNLNFVGYGVTATDDLANDQTDVTVTPLGWFNVKDYGAVGDNTTDDTAAINLAIAALNAATTGGGVLYFPEATYKTTGALTAITCYAMITGDGLQNSEIKCNSSTAITFTHTGGFGLFRDISITNNSVGTPSAGAGIQCSGSGVPTVNFENVRVSRYYINVDTQVNDAWHMQGCFLYNPILYALKIRNTVNPDAGDYNISDTTISRDTGTPTAAIRIETSGGAKLSNVKIQGAFTYGLSLHATGTTGQLMIDNSSLENWLTNGILIDNQAGITWKDILIRGCQFGTYGSQSGAAIQITANTLGDHAEIVIASNTFRGVASQAFAINLVKAQNVQIYGNVWTGYTALLTQSGTGAVGSLIVDAPIRINPTGAANTDILTYNSTSGSWIASAASTVPGTGGALATTTPVDISGSGLAGTSASGARNDHVHRGVLSISASGNAPSYGGITFIPGTNASISQSGGSITISGGSGGGGTSTSIIAGTGASVSNDGAGLYTVSMTGSGWTSAIQLANRTTGVTYTNGSLTRFISAAYAASTTIIAQAQLQLKTGAASPPVNVVAEELSAGVADSQRFTLQGLVLPNEYYTILDLSQAGASVNLFKWTEYDNYGGAPAPTLVSRDFGGRLSYDGSNAVYTADITAASVLWYVPYKHNQISLYTTGSVWNTISFTAPSLALTGLSPNSAYDIFGFQNGAELTLETARYLATTNLARTTSLSAQDGVQVAATNRTRLHLGTLYIGATSAQSADQDTQRFLWNKYNRVNKRLYRKDSTASWSYSTAAWRIADNSSNNRVEIVTGFPDAALELHNEVLFESTNIGIVVEVGVAENSTSAPAGGNMGQISGAVGLSGANHVYQEVHSQFRRMPDIGYHFYQWLEQGGGAGTQTWFGTAGTTEVAGIIGSIDV